VRLEQPARPCVAVDVVPIATPVDFGETVMQRSTSSARRFGSSSRSCFEVRVAPHDPDVAEHSYSMRAERPVRRSARNSSSNRQPPSPSSRITISRSENDV
jgi:hypothetical protein